MVLMWPLEVLVASLAAPTENSAESFARHPALVLLGQLGAHADPSSPATLLPPQRAGIPGISEILPLWVPEVCSLS